MAEDWTDRGNEEMRLARVFPDKGYRGHFEPRLPREGAAEPLSEGMGSRGPRVPDSVLWRTD